MQGRLRPVVVGFSLLLPGGRVRAGGVSSYPPARHLDEGGFLGIGGTRVSDKEESTLTDIRAALGVKA